MNFTQVVFKELVLRGSRVYTKVDYSRAIELLIPEKDNLESLISHRFRLEKAPEALGLIKQKREGNEGTSFLNKYLEEK